MENFKNLQEATDYIYDKLKETNPDVEKDDVYETILDEILESSEYIMLDEDARFLEENAENQQAIDEYLQSKISDYHDLLNDIVTDMVSEDVVEE